MSYEIILNNSDTVCKHCGTELPKGTDVIIDKTEPQIGTFCLEWEGIEGYCWNNFYKNEYEDDPYNEIARENTLAAQSRYRNDDDL